MLKVTVTQAHVKRARRLSRDYLLSECCPVTLAIYDALGRTINMANLADGAAPIWSAPSCVGIDGRQHATPEVVTEIVNWFDGVGGSTKRPDPAFPITFELEGV